MSRSLGMPVKLLHEALGHIVTVELKSGELYRGSMVECEDNWNCQLENITYIAKDGKASQLENVFIRGSKVRGRSVAMRAKAQAAGLAAPGRGAVPPVDDCNAWSVDDRNAWSVDDCSLLVRRMYFNLNIR
ncbi:hypothetical protein GH714_023056 [Hevea brasiliensis]|uniref:Small nuclear ribonucleoprotein Sm D3 n=1 Tax=Hevea brasiliensis TaxID=3981 RepID=A0A6A6KTH3_HEVBR|nr:hypothetical protein GH714_023056 [Hevea brasiliensis]